MKKLLLLFIMIIGCISDDPYKYLQPFEINTIQSGIKYCKDHGYEYRLGRVALTGSIYVECKVVLKNIKTNAEE